MCKIASPLKLSGFFFFVGFFVLQLVLQQIVNILNLAKQIIETLTAVELPGWKHRQQMACIGSPADTSLELLQKW